MCKKIVFLFCILIGFASCSPPTWQEMEQSYNESCPEEVRKSIGNHSQKSAFEEDVKNHCDCIFTQMKKRYKSPIDSFKDKKIKTFMEDATKYCASKHLGYLIKG